MKLIVEKIVNMFSWYIEEVIIDHTKSKCTIIVKDIKYIKQIEDKYSTLAIDNKNFYKIILKVR